MSGTFAGRRIWITGAGSGIGAALGRAFLAAGASVALSARNEEALTEIARLAPERSLVIPIDVRSREANRLAADRIEARFGGLDLVILNAGICEYLDDVRHFDAELFRRHMETNYMGLVNGIEATLPMLLAATEPRLVGMSSIVAWRGVPRGAAYAASKAAIRNLLEGLRIDLAAHGIPVSIISPGFVKTPLTDRNDFAMPLRIDADRAAAIILRGLARGRHEIAFPFRFALVARLLTALPSPLYGWLMRRGRRR